MQSFACILVVVSEPTDDDAVFKGLADPTRRGLLDSLRRHEGVTLSDLCKDVSMSRQSVTQHLDQLVDAGLVVVVRRGRERWHYLNAAPLHDITSRWLRRFDVVHLAAMHTIKELAEEPPVTDVSPLPAYVYVTYIQARPERVWAALTDPAVTAIYWDGMANVSDWQVGSPWTHQTPHGNGDYDIWGSVLEADPPRLLKFTFQPAAQDLADHGSTVTYLIEEAGGSVRLTVTHENLPDQAMLDGVSQGWPTVLSSLKSYLEIGSPLVRTAAAS